MSGVRALGTTPGSNEAAFLRDVGDGTVYKGQELRGDRDSAIQNVSRNKQAVLNAIAAHLQRRFSSFSNEDIFKNMSIFNFKNWPLGLEELRVYGNEKLSSVVDHFEELLIRNDCDIDFVPLEWVELNDVSGLVAAEPAVSYLDLWQRVIRQNEDRFKNIILVLMIVLLIPIRTSEVERGFSLMNRVK